MLVILLSLAASPAWACMCVRERQTVDDEVATLMAQYAIVGVYQVVGSTHGAQVDEDGTLRSRWLDLQPRRVFKGERVPLRATVNRRWFSSCGLKIRKGELLLVYASPDTPMRLSFCSTTQSLTRRFDHLAVLFRRFDGDGT